VADIFVCAVATHISDTNTAIGVASVPLRSGIHATGAVRHSEVSASVETPSREPSNFNEISETMDLSPIWLTIRLAAVTTAILLVVGTPAAWWLARTRFRFKAAIEALIAMPIVLPPTVLGFYLLIAMGPHSFPGSVWQAVFGEPLAFTFTGLVIGSILYSMPFVVQPIQNAFEGMGSQPLEIAATLRASPMDRFFSIALPYARRGIITASTIGFAHTVGEFGVVLMIGGNIPGKTRVLSIAIYDHVEALEYRAAHWLSAGLIVFAFSVLLAVYIINRRWAVRP